MTTPDRLGDDRGQDAPGSVAEDPTVREIVKAWQLPPDDEPPAEGGASCPRPWTWVIMS